MEIEQTAHHFETNAHANFHMAENAALCVSDTMLRQSQGPRRVPREHAECFLSIVGHTNAEQWYH